MKEYRVEESLKIFREAGFTRLEMARGHLVPCKIHELIKIREGDGSPVRAMALIDQHGPFPAAEKGPPE